MYVAISFLRAAVFLFSPNGNGSHNPCDLKCNTFRLLPASIFKRWSRKPNGNLCHHRPYIIKCNNLLSPPTHRTINQVTPLPAKINHLVSPSSNICFLLLPPQPPWDPCPAICLVCFYTLCVTFGSQLLSYSMLVQLLTNWLKRAGCSNNKGIGKFIFSSSSPEEGSWTSRAIFKDIHVWPQNWADQLHPPSV